MFAHFMIFSNHQSYFSATLLLTEGVYPEHHGVPFSSSRCLDFLSHYVILGIVSNNP